jgi:hypothetical protein
MNEFPLQIFVLDVVTIFLIVLLFVQFYYIHKLHVKLGEQNESITQLKEMVYSIYQTSQNKLGTEALHHKVGKSTE